MLLEKILENFGENSRRCERVWLSFKMIPQRSLEKKVKGLVIEGIFKRVSDGIYKGVSG